MRNITLIAAVIITAAGWAGAAEEQSEFKFAYVNMEKVATEYVLFTEAAKDAQAKIKAAQDTDTAKLQEYQAIITDLEKKLSGPLAPEAKAQAEKDYQAKVDEALAYRDELMTKYKKIERDTFEPVYKKIYDKIGSYSEKNKYDVVFDYSATLLYADKTYDVTDDVLKELNEEAGVTTPPGGGGGQ